MIERSQQLRAFQTHGQVAKPRALGGAGDDSDVSWHSAILPGLILAGLWAAGSVAGQPHEGLRYPTAARGSVVEQYHGTAVADPYRWLEDLDSPATRAWVSAEASLTHAYLEALPQRARLRARLAALYDFEKRGIPFREGGRYFYTDNSGQQDQSVLLTATRLGDAAAVAVDPNTLPRAGNPVVTGYVPNRAGTLLAYAVSMSGSDWTEWRVPHLSTDGRWLIVRADEGEVGDKGRENLYLIDLTASVPAATPVAQGFEAAYVYVGADAGWLYFLTSLDAPNGRVLAIDPEQPARANWKSVIPQGRDAIDLGGTSVTLVDHQLIVRTVHDAHSRVMTYGLDGTPRREITLPGAGTAAGFDGHPGDRETLYSFTDLITPPTIYRYDLEAGASPRLPAARPP